MRMEGVSVGASMRLHSIPRRRLVQQLRGGTAQDQEVSGKRFAVGQHAQERKQFGPPLEFANDHQPLEWPQGQARFAQAGQALRVFQVKVIQRIRGNEMPRQRCLAALARPEKRYNPASLERRAHEVDIRFAFDHASQNTMKS